MKKIAFLMLDLALAAAGHAQGEVGSWTLTTKVGVSWAKLSGSDIYYGADADAKLSPAFRRGIALGLEAEWQHHAMASLSAGIGYSQQGTRYDDIPNVLKDAKVSLDYIALPVMEHIYIAPGLAVQAGFQMGLATHREVSGEEYFSEGNVSGMRGYKSHQTYYRTFDCGIPLGLSYDLERLRLELRYYFGLYDTTKFGMKERGRALQLAVGYRFGL